MEVHLKRVILIAAACAFFFIVSSARAQQLDAGFSVSGVTATPASSAGAGYQPQTMGGGAFPGFSADYLMRHHFGFAFEVNWRAKQNTYQGVQPFRPILYDFNGVFVPPLGKKAALELQGGIGVSSTRFYQPFFTCSLFSCTNFAASNHFLGHVGGGIRFYFWHNVFLRPEAHYYAIHNNIEFAGSRVTRFGVTLGYTFRGE